MANPSGHHHEVSGRGSGKTVSQGAPDVHGVAGLPVDHSAGQFADNDVAEVDSDRVAVVIADDVVQCERPPQQGVAATLLPDHEELSGNDLPGQLRTFQSQPVGVAGHADLFDHLGRLLAGGGDESGER